MTKPTEQAEPRRPRGTRSAGHVLTAAGALTAAVLATVATPAHATTTSPRAAATTAHARATVPWSKVGSGWVVATWARTATSGQTVYLVAPGGTRYRITDVARYTRVIDWTTAGGARALVDSSLGVREINLRTGARHTIPGLAVNSVYGYARPGARAVLASVLDAKNDTRLVRVGLTGKRLATYPSSVSRSGALHVEFTPPVAVRTSTAIVVGARHGLVELGERARVLKRLFLAGNNCTATSLLKPGVVVARCGTGALYAVPLSGARVTRLTAGPGQQNPFGYDSIWSYSRGRLGTSPNGCGPDSLVRFDAKGSGTRFVPPAPVGGTGIEVFYAHHGDVVEATFHHGGCMDSTTTLFSWNAATGRSTALLGPGVNGGSVTSTAPFAYDRITG